VFDDDFFFELLKFIYNSPNHSRRAGKEHQIQSPATSKRQKKTQLPQSKTKPREPPLT